MMIQLRKLYLFLITVAAVLLVNNFAVADSTQKNNKTIVNDESQSLSAPPAPPAESPHGISERSNANEGDQSSSALSGSPNNNAPCEEKHKSSSGSHPKH